MSNAIDTFSQTTAPKVHWRRFDWASQNPIISNSAASGQTFTRKESGSDWWYDVKNSFEPGATEDYPMPGMVHNGYILSGYSNIRNYTEAENGGGCNQAQMPQNLNCSYYEEGSDPTTPSWFHTVAKLKPDGLTMEWFHFLPFSGNGYRVTQLIDGSFIVVGDSKSTRNFNGNEIFYDPHFDAFGDPVFNAFCDGTNSLNPNSDGLINPKFIGVSHILANGTIDWTYNYGYFDFTFNNAFNDANINASAADAWDVKQSLPSGNIIILGTAEGPGVKNAFALSINIDGMRISKRLINIDAPINVANPGLNKGAIGKTLTCKNINGIEKIIIGTMVFSEVPSLLFRTRTYIAQFNADLTDNPNSTNGDDWHLWLHDIQATPVNGADQQNIFSIIQLANTGNTNRYAVGMLKNCSYCSSAGNQNGEITVLTFEESNNIPTIANIHNCGAGNAFDLRVGLCKNIFSTDNGFALVSSKPNPDAANRPPFNCNITGGNITIHDYFDADTYIAAFDDVGSLKWENTYIDEQDETAPQLPPGNYKKQECMYSIVQTPDGGYMAAGNQSNNFDDNYLIKLMPENCADVDYVYDITTNETSGVPFYYEHPAYVIKHPTGGSFGNAIFSEEWNSSKKVKATVVIPSGFELIITGPSTIISFDDSKQTGKDSKIIVLPGGKLRIENGAKLTSHKNCVLGLWDGIEVFGINGYSQDLAYVNLDANRPNELMSLNQGFVEIVGGSTIENAMAAVTAYSTDFFKSGDFDVTGGIIQASDANFINNRNDIDIAWYHDFNTATNTETKNKCNFKRCNFETNSALVNPGAINEMICDMQLPLLYTDKHIHLWNVNGVNIEGCTFKTDLPAIAGKKPNYSKGIEAFDASFTCTVSDTTRSSFINLQYGILNGSYNGSCDPQQYNTLNAPIAKIDRSYFQNCMRGIELDGTILTNINRCKFLMNTEYGNNFYANHSYDDDELPLYGAHAKTPVGIYTNAALAYRIKDNKFKSFIGTDIGDDALAYGMVNTNTSAFIDGITSYNEYSNYYVHQQFEEINTHLKTNCNKHFNTEPMEHYSWSVFNDLAPQGECFGSLMASETNLFDNNSFGSPQRDIHLDNFASTFAYNSNPGFVPQFHNLGVISTCGNLPIDIFEAACPANIYPRSLSFHHGVYAKNNLDYRNLKKLIDQDSTEVLLQYIEDNNLEVIKNLPDSSRNLLSDETLIAMIDRLPPADWNDFTTILLNNSPLNPRLMELINESSEIPNPIKQTISNAQTGESVRSVIDKELLRLEAEKGLSLYELISALIDTGYVDTAFAILSNDGSIGAKMIGLALDPYSHFGFNYATALNKDYLLMQRLGNNAEAIIQLHDYLDYYINIINTSAKLDTLDTSGEAVMSNIASVTSIDGIYASVALAATNKAVYGYNPKPIKIVNGYRESPPEIEEPNSNLSILNRAFNFTIQPNPANDIVQLVFNNELPTFIEISDLTGKVLLSKVVQNSNSININLNEFATGFYLVKALNAVYEFKIEKLVILK